METDTTLDLTENSRSTLARLILDLRYGRKTLNQETLKDHSYQLTNSPSDCPRSQEAQPQGRNIPHRSHHC